MTELHTYIPQFPLSDYVYMLWSWEGYHPPHPKERILPGGFMEMVINLADEPLTLRYGADQLRPNHFYGPIVAGPRSDFFVVDTARPASILAVYFKPGAALPFFGAAASDLHNLHVPLDVFWHGDAHDLYCRLLEAQTVQRRFHILEMALIEQLAYAENRHRAVDYALAAFMGAPQTQTVTQVIDQIGLSATRFIQVFNESIGLTPKRFCRVQRFQQAAQMIATSAQPNFVEIALACGYYDQAHFINDFQAFAGITPTEYAPQSRDHFSNLPYFD